MHLKMHVFVAGKRQCQSLIFPLRRQAIAAFFPICFQGIAQSHGSTKYSCNEIPFHRSITRTRHCSTILHFFVIYFQNENPMRSMHLLTFVFFCASREWATLFVCMLRHAIDSRKQIWWIALCVRMDLMAGTGQLSRWHGIWNFHV